MIQFQATILKFARQGEKTGWTYIEIPEAIAQQLKPGNKKSFRVKGRIDNYSLKGMSLLPMGGGNFIMAVNATIRKGIGKAKGSMVRLQLEEDKKGYQLPAAFLECLHDEPIAMEFFKKQTLSVQHYFGKWIDTAKTETTKIKRIAIAVTALSQKQSFSEMLRSQQKNRDELFK